VREPLDRDGGEKRRQQELEVEVAVSPAVIQQQQQQPFVELYLLRGRIKHTSSQKRRDFSVKSGIRSGYL
jgi:hypothetical protein